MRADDLLKKLTGEMSKRWQEAHDYEHSFAQRARALENDIRKEGRDLCGVVKRELAIAVQKKALGAWCSVSMSGPGYILQHGGPRAIRTPYLSFYIGVGGNSEINYNLYEPKSMDEIREVCSKLAEVVDILKDCPGSRLRKARL